MKSRVAVCLFLCALPAVCADWNPKLAAEYLDARQKEWFEWPKANAGAKPCISCHTSVTYLMARPALRKALGESGPTAYESGLLKSLTDRVEKREPAAAASLGVESVLAALLVGSEQALDRMWALQIKEGDAKGSWHWFSLNDDPWEMPESNFYGATLAAMALAGAPAEYRERPAVKERAAELTAFLRSGQAGQPLHNRVMLLLASKKMPEVLTADARRSVVEALWQRQQADGGWTMASLGPFKVQEGAPRQEGSNGYATALVAYVMGQTEPGNPKLKKAQGWLRTHQNEAGYWAAVSMNKVYPAGSMESKFMNDAATAFATMALLESGK
ncbi:MAG: putative squalene-hopene cyclase [Candidatus Solibacter sp.]|nr:putative squalene-hopene cyclase [Candidatus Solibacter sp.]